MLDGRVNGNLDFAGSAVTLNNSVGGDVNVSVGDRTAKGTASQIQTLLVFLPFKAELIDPGLTLGAQANISGSLTYRAYQPLEDTESQQVAGDTSYEAIQSGLVLEDLADEERRSSALGEYFAQVLRDFTTLGLLGLFMLALTPGFVQACFAEMRQRSLTHVGVGLLGVYIVVSDIAAGAGVVVVDYRAAVVCSCGWLTGRVGGAVRPCRYWRRERVLFRGHLCLSRVSRVCAWALACVSIHADKYHLVMARESVCGHAHLIHVVCVAHYRVCSQCAGALLGIGCDFWRDTGTNSQTARVCPNAAC